MNNSLTPFDSLAAGLFGALLDPRPQKGALPSVAFRPVHVSRLDDKVQVSMDMPGAKIEDINIEYIRGVLRIDAERRAETRDDDGQVIQKTVGNYSQSVMMKDIDEDSIEAEFVDGVLTVTAAPSEKVQPRKVQIKGMKPKSETEQEEIPEVTSE